MLVGQARFIHHGVDRITDSGWSPHRSRRKEGLIVTVITLAICVPYL
jgi:hypothetical protein